MPRCANYSCGRWRPGYPALNWASGIRFNGHWYCSRACVEHAVLEGLDTPAVVAASPPSLPPLRLGVLLRHLGAISESDLQRGLDAQRASGRRLGAELRQLGLLSVEPLLRALAAQSNVSYLTAFDIGRVVASPAWLPPDTARALGLVPFELNETQRRVRVVCMAPVPRGAVRALLKLTGWAAEPYLVADEVWHQAMRAYRPAGLDSVRPTITVPSVAAAAAHVADSAMANRSITMRHASYDGYTWVRVEGPYETSDLLVARAT